MIVEVIGPRSRAKTSLPVARKIKRAPCGAARGDAGKGFGKARVDRPIRSPSEARGSHLLDDLGFHKCQFMRCHFSFGDIWECFLELSNEKLVLVDELKS